MADEKQLNDKMSVATYQVLQNNQPTQDNTNEEKKYVYDELKMYFGEPYKVTDKITIYQPTIGDIIAFGDSRFYSIVSTLCSNTTSFRLQLWDMGIDWNNFSDFQLFALLTKNMTVNDTSLLFGNINFSWFEQYVDKDTEQLNLVYIPRDEDGNIPETFSLEDTIIINEDIYLNIVDYLRSMFDIHPKVEKAKNKATKEAIIDEERINLEIERTKKAKEKKSKNKSVLFPLVSAMVNHAGFKYKKNELREVGIVEFMDSVKRLQTYESVRAFMSGMYSGMIDTSKMDLNKELNWQKDLYE